MQSVRTHQFATSQPPGPISLLDQPSAEVHAAPSAEHAVLDRCSADTSLLHHSRSLAVSEAMALYMVRDACVHELRDMMTSHVDSSSMLHEEVQQMCMAAGCILRSMLSQLTEQDVAWQLQSGQRFSDRTHRALCEHPALTLRLLHLGMPIACWLMDGVSMRLLAALHDCQLKRSSMALWMPSLAFLPAGLDLAHSPFMQRHHLSCIAIAREKARSAKPSEITPFHMEQLLQDMTQDWSCAQEQPHENPEELKHESVQLCVQVVHEWCLHSDRVHTLLLDAMSSPCNGARAEVRIISECLDLEPLEK